MFGKLVDNFLEDRKKQPVSDTAKSWYLWKSMVCPLCQEVKCDDNCEHFEFRKNNT